MAGVSAEKPEGYYGNERRDVVEMLPRPVGAVLDVGCGDGANAAALREAGATRIAGIEVVPEAAQRARERFDEVLTGTVEERIGDLEGPFDTILFLDVLEHLVDPAAVLRAAHRVAAPGAHVQVSVPNARHYSLVRDLMLRGTFGYADWGHRDSTHLRWFTRRDVEALLRDAGWDVLRTSHPALGRSRALDRVTRGRSTEFLVGQWYVLARAPR
ncbi:MAG TPA: class I SAM-dependent methyltransferase [Solirubrobacteraceae bacterium]|nr:class I SAM-dependent methyltransferase [Solirubrobacteraceae bacterium]